MITELAPAKINLALHVRHRRADGYHDIETLFAFCAEGDVVQVEQAERDSFTSIGPFAASLHSSPEREGGPSVKPMGEGRPHNPTNLVVQAADAFRLTFGIEAAYAITLDKRLPIASGIGGGSADAAATIRALVRLHDASGNDPRLAGMAGGLGADVPACLHGRTALGTGRGDALTPLEGLAGTPVLLVNPRVAVSTGAVFNRWDGSDRGPIGEGTLLHRARTGRNDLEPPARELAPVIGEVRSLLDQAPGAILSRMSGSGATCFALFSDRSTRDAAAVQATARGWWTLATALS